MNRRHLLALASGIPVAAGLSSQVRAQPASLPRIAYVSGRSLGTDGHLLQAFRNGLKTQGFVDGQNVTMDVRWADGDFSKVPGLLKELIALKPTLIAALGGNPVGIAAKAATTTIPVVFGAGADPTQIGLVNSLNRPEGNLTGITLWAGELDVKRLDLLREMVPGVKKVALLTNPTNPGATKEQEAMEAASDPLGMKLETFKVTGTSDIDRAFEQMPPGKFDALAVVGDPFLISRRDKIVGLAAQRRLPTIYPAREFTESGGLASYGARWADMYVIMGTYAGRILKGEKPADLPVQRPTTYELVINQRTAKALGLVVPQILLARADEVIE
ncbi:MAG TPA: ABC transporter substrate-binding protein [Reyranella sp.]|nr:ABC transporter substrate-binding protein [Reyranella sp.]